MLHVSANSFSQGLVFGTVQDAFLKTPLPEAKVSLLLAADSTVIIDSIPVTNHPCHQEIQGRRLLRLLHQLSNTQYSVNAQGRTETWYRSLPHYVMAHLVYHRNKNPKKK